MLFWVYKYQNSRRRSLYCCLFFPNVYNSLCKKLKKLFSRRKCRIYRCGLWTGLSSRASVDGTNPQPNKINELALLAIALTRFTHTVHGSSCRSMAWLLEMSATCLVSHSRAIVMIKYGKVKKFKINILEQFPNKLTEQLDKSFKNCNIKSTWSTTC